MKRVDSTVTAAISVDKGWGAEGGEGEWVSIKDNYKNEWSSLLELYYETNSND